MSWVASGYVKTLTVSPTGQQITRGEKLVLLILADYHNQENNLCNPSINRLADEALYERRQIMRVIESLESKGFIEVERFPGENRKNEYVICGLYPSVKCSDKMSPLPSSDKKRPGVVTFQEGGSDILASKMSPELVLTSKKQERQQASSELFPDKDSDITELPEWKEFVEMRRKDGHPLVTDGARSRIISRLRNLDKSGHSIVKVLQQSCDRTWTDVYELKNGKPAAAVIAPEPDALEVMRQKERIRYRQNGYPEPDIPGGV